MAVEGNDLGKATAVQVDPGDETPPSDVPAAFAGKDLRLTPYGTTNLGTPPELLADVDGLTVPNDRFFVRSNGPTPIISPETWRLRIGGLVERELILSLTDLQVMPGRTLTAFLECSGNSRSRFVPTAEGTPWQDDAVGNATWSGVSLPTVLDLAGLRDEAVEIVSQGGDFTGMQRGLPLPVARDPDTLLAWEMNGEPLPLPHGGPVRLLVPGWGGIASTKWLVGLEVIDRPFDGPWNTDSYVFYDA
ncbi:MAG: molybdopterin-dependent oxidoreductase, partial [Chloroflexota bacterium]|nr:molybdopterin-dependent oxidoreductase [Chloroflexota bacterium]